ERDLRVHQVADVQGRVADEGLHQVGFGQANVLDGVGGQEAVLHVEERRFGFFGGAPGNEGEVAGLLGIARVEHSPSAVGDANYVVVAGMHVERLGGERACADVEDNG